MKKTITALCLALATSLAMAAAPSDASIEELLDVTQASKMTDAMVKQISAAMLPAFEQSIDLEHLDEASREKARRYMAIFSRKMDKVLTDELSWERMKSDSVQIYREVFTQEEVDALIAFYRTPAGRAMLEKMPLVMQKSMALMKGRMPQMMKRLQQLAQETAQEFQQR